MQISLILCLLVAISLYFLKPLLTKLAVAQVNERSAHSGIVPQGAGGVIFLLLYCANLFMQGFKLDPTNILLLHCLSLSVLGFIDDAKGLSVRLRLILQTIIVISAINFLFPYNLYLFIFFTFILIANINATNFMDGMDLMTITHAICLCLGLGIAAHLHLAPQWFMLLFILTIFAFLGFIPMNKPKAKMFLGDSGSLPLGLLLGIMLIFYAQQSGVFPALIMSGYYIADAGNTLITRMWRRERFWEGHKQHFYQQAMQKGMSVWVIIAHILLLNLILVATSITLALNPEYHYYCLAVAILAIRLTLFRFMK